MGPKLGPFLVGCTLGLMTFSTAGVAAGYQGAGMNPARCFSFAVARANFKCRHSFAVSQPWHFVDLKLDQWIWWVGPITGALVHGVIYHVVPPYHREQTLARATMHHPPNHA